MCYPNLVHPARIEVHPAMLNGIVVPDSFNFRVLFAGTENWQIALHVHVPRQLQGNFERGEVVGFAMEQLQTNTAAAKAFPVQPSAVVLGVDLKNGQRVNVTPAELDRAFWRCMLAGGLTVLGGTVVAACFGSTLAAALAALGTHFWRTGWQIPRRPAW